MTKSPLPVPQMEVDQRFSKLLKDFGVSIENIASRLHYKSHSTVSRWFNWEEADQSPFLMVLRLLEVIRDEEPAAAGAAVDLLNYFAEQVTGQSGKSAPDYKQTLNKIQSSASEMLGIFLSELSYEEMLPYARAIKQNAAEMETALMAADMEEGGQEEKRPKTPRRIEQVS